MKVLVKGKPESCKECVFYHATSSLQSVRHTLCSNGGGFHSPGSGSIGGIGGGGSTYFPDHSLGFKDYNECSILGIEIPENISDKMRLNNCPLEEMEK